jgi:hypothetical protein
MGAVRLICGLETPDSGVACPICWGIGRGNGGDERSTAATTSSSGNVVARVAYFPFGGTRSASGPLNTDRVFTGQRLDDTGLYY